MTLHPIWEHFLTGVWLTFVVVIPVLVADPNKRLARKPFGLRLLGIFIAFYFPVAFRDIESEGIYILFVLIPAGILVLLTTLFSVYRTQDIGWSKYLCLLGAVPFANVVYFVVLLFKPGALQNDTRSPVP